MRTYVEFSALTDEERQDFVEGFKNADDIGVDDWETSTPWGAPWEWADGMSVTRGVVSAYAMGEAWFEHNRSRILGISPVDERTLLDAMGSQTTGEDVKQFLAWGKENCIDVVELAKYGEENDFYGALEKCFGKGAQ